MAEGTDTTFDEIAKYVRTAAPESSLALRRNAESLVNRYISTFREADWTFIGSEVRLPGARLDLVWRDTAGVHWIDELKTGSNPDHLGHRTREQLARYRELGAEEFERFGGIRLCVLRHPRHSLLVRPDGSVARLSIGSTE